jgi:hypothetical protein
MNSRFYAGALWLSGIVVVMTTAIASAGRHPAPGKRCGLNAMVKAFARLAVGTNKLSTIKRRRSKKRAQRFQLN